MDKVKIHYLLKLTACSTVIILILLSIAVFVPKKFPAGTIVRVQKDATLSDVTASLSKRQIILSKFLFKGIFSLFYGQRKVMAGDYVFDQPQNLWIVTSRLAKGEHGLPIIKVTIPEGSTVQDIAWILLKKIPDFNAPYFIKIARQHEGYLFPDTYRFYPNTTPEDVLKTLRETFNIKIKPLMISISMSGRTSSDIVIMASLLEREASSTTDREIIAGILWKRLDEKMLLQVDAPFVYITGNNFVSLADLKIDSPYNTYKYRGLPKGPIANPGLNAIKAAINPTKTPYYYYLSDQKGNMHYATTHDGHLVNRDKYLWK
jgi:UPF0755 protein